MLLSTCLRIQPSARPSCAKISHTMCELLQVQPLVSKETQYRGKRDLV